MNHLTRLTLGLALFAAMHSTGTAQKDRKEEVNTPPARGERLPDRLKEGDVAPDFSLPRVRGKGEVKLSSFRGKRPVVLIFGSYT